MIRKRKKAPSARPIVSKMYSNRAVVATYASSPAYFRTPILFYASAQSVCIQKA